MYYCHSFIMSLTGDHSSLPASQELVRVSDMTDYCTGLDELNEGCLGVGGKGHLMDM